MEHTPLSYRHMMSMEGSTSWPLIHVFMDGFGGLGVGVHVTPGSERNTV